MLGAVLGPPRTVKWFVGYQLACLALTVVLLPIVASDLGLLPSLLHLWFVLLGFLAIQIFLIWKVWEGKNWARLTILAWTLLPTLEPFTHGIPAPEAVHVLANIKFLGMVLGILDALSFVVLFTNSANEWFRSTPAKQSLLFPG